MVWRCAILTCLFVVSACGAPRTVEPSTPPSVDTSAALSAPAGPVMFEPEQLIFPPEEFPVDAQVTRDAPVASHGWEREFLTPASVDFRWFSVRLFVLEPDLAGSRFVADNGCGAVSWPDEQPAAAQELDPPRTGDAARACRYTFRDGARVLYLTTGYRNVGMLLAAQPRRAEMSDDLSLRWLSALAQKQIAIIGRVMTVARY